MNKAEIGSRTAKGGFANERAICSKFNDWKKDKEAKHWLEIMGYNVKKITEVKALCIPGRIKKTSLSIYGMENENYEILSKFKKADLQVRVLIKIGDILSIENISLKKANKSAGFNHVDRRWVDFYQEIWKFDDEIALWLKLFTGEIKPKTRKDLVKNYKTLKYPNRLLISEMDISVQNKIIRFFEKNKILFVSDVLKGRGGLSADWMLVTMHDKTNNTTSWVLKDINAVMNFYGQGETRLSPKGSLFIGRIFMQRKGATGNPTQLQFKFNPNQLFEIDG